MIVSEIVSETASEINLASELLNEEIMEVLFMSFGAALLAGFTFFFASWGAVSALNVYRKLI